MRVVKRATTRIFVQRSFRIQTIATDNMHKSTSVTIFDQMEYLTIAAAAGQDNLGSHGVGNGQRKTLATRELIATSKMRVIWVLDA